MIFRCQTSLFLFEQIFDVFFEIIMLSSERFRECQNLYFALKTSLECPYMPYEQNIKIYFFQNFHDFDDFLISDLVKIPSLLLLCLCQEGRNRFSPPKKESDRIGIYTGQIAFKLSGNVHPMSTTISERFSAIRQLLKPGEQKTLQILEMAGKFSNGWQILVANFPKSIDFRSNPQTL